MNVVVKKGFVVDVCVVWFRLGKGLIAMCTKQGTL